jgi:hypothetical protein
MSTNPEYPRKYRRYFTVQLVDGECQCFIDVLQSDENTESVIEAGAITGNKVTQPDWLNTEVEREMNNKFTGA